jgi:hypothetical protein
MGLSQSRLRELLHYNPRTGVFTWRVTHGYRAIRGQFAGSSDTRGYNRIQINGVKYRSSHLAFTLMTGRWPTKLIDHINRDTSDDRWRNLREATPIQNQANATIRKGKTVPLKGVTWNTNKQCYIAQIKINNRQIHLGNFNNSQQAHTAYIIAARKYFGEFARTK